MKSDLESLPPAEETLKQQETRRNMPESAETYRRLRLESKHAGKRIGKLRQNPEKLESRRLPSPWNTAGKALGRDASWGRLSLVWLFQRNSLN